MAAYLTVRCILGEHLSLTKTFSRRVAVITRERTSKLEIDNIPGSKFETVRLNFQGTLSSNFQVLSARFDC